MLVMRGAQQRQPRGFSRRDILRVGSLGGVGLTLPGLSQAVAKLPAASEPNFGRAKRCLMLFLTGGPPQHDTFDLKPDAPREIRGEFKPIATTVPGIEIGELLPHLARHADKFCLVRSVTHADTVHPSAGYTMLTGVAHPQANAPGGAKAIRPTQNDHPHIGSLVARYRPGRTGMPAFASLPEIVRDDAVNEFPGQDAGFLGKQYGPFQIEADESRRGFARPEIVLPAEVSTDRLHDRKSLLQELDQCLRAAETRASVADVDTFYQQAFDLIKSPAVRGAFALDEVPLPLRAAYGAHLFGQSCLLARRLLEAGVSLVTVYWHYEGPRDSPVWDTHQHNFPHLRERLLPPTDQAISAVLDDLSASGLLQDTLVICFGEFGRTPRINGNGGRDHWPHVQSVLLAGAGIRGGTVYGSSDRTGAYPAKNPVSPADLTATLLHVLGIRPDVELTDRTGRRVAACSGTPLFGLFSGKELGT